MSEPIRGFTIGSQAWYAEAVGREKERIMIGVYYDDGASGTDGEFAIQWDSIDGRDCPQIKAWNDSWCVLPQFADVFRSLSRLKDDLILVDEVAAALLSCGLKDLTERVRP